MMSTLLSLPIDLIIHILQFLTIFELYTFQQVNTTSNIIGNQPNTITELTLHLEPLNPSHSLHNWSYFNSKRFKTAKIINILRGGLSFEQFNYWLSSVIPNFLKVQSLFINNFDDDDHYNISSDTLLQTFPNTNLIQKLYFKNINLMDAIPFITSCFNLVELGICIIHHERNIDSQISTYLKKLSEAIGYKQQQPFKNLQVLVIDESCISSTGMQIFTYWILNQAQMVLEIYENDFAILNQAVMDQFLHLFDQQSLCKLF